jgi:hypothetical protein
VQSTAVDPSALPMMLTQMRSARWARRRSSDSHPVAGKLDKKIPAFAPYH